MQRIAIVLLFVVAGMAPAARCLAGELLKVAVPQRGLWDTSPTELGQRAGIFRKRGLEIEILYTQGGPESQQGVISGSVDLACGGGIEATIGAYGRAAPVRIIGSSMIGSPDTYWYVLANSPIRSLRDAAGKTISFSQVGSSSHSALLALLDQYKIDAKPVATGGHPATLTMAMTGQIDIGRGAAPFGLDLVDKGEIRIIARGSEIAARANQTVRVCIANVPTLENRKDTVAAFMQGYREALDWMYSDPSALKAYEEFSHVPERLMTRWRDEFFPKAALWPDEIKGLDITLADALKTKFIAKPFTDEQVKDLVRIPPPIK
jgi:NitT/TauT family transport system substrate-binding protein